MHRFILIAAAATWAFAAEYKIPATPETLVWGHYWAGQKPVLTVNSGDIVEMQTVSGNPEAAERAGVPPGDVPQHLRNVFAHPPADRGPGGHVLTGPVAIEGAMPGDTLEVRIREIRMDVPYAINTPGLAGFLSDAFPVGHARVIRLDREHLVGHFAGVDLPLKPFFGSMGVAPADIAGKINSGPPGRHAGNLDNKELVAGTTLFIPVLAPGALFQVGDGHAGQGDGEVDITAMETSLTGVFQFILHKNQNLKWPRAETPTHYIAMGLDPDLTQATRVCIFETIDFLEEHLKITREEAYALTSIGVDLRITQLVDGTKGVHAMIPKTLLANAK